MTNYYDKRNKWRKDKDTPISVRDYTNTDEDKTYYCNNCNRNLHKLIDSSGENPSYYCNHCSIEVIPSLTEVRSKSKIVTPEGPPDNPAVAFPPEVELKRKKVEIKGGLAELQKRGIRIKNYTESKG